MPSPVRKQPLKSPDQPAAILLVSPYSEDHLLLPGILKHRRWQWNKSQSCREAQEFLQSHTVTVLICERDQPDGCWQDLLDAAAKQASPPSLIVFSRLADEYLWAEVLNLGGYDVIVKPFDHGEVLRIAFLAWRSWKSRCTELAAAQAAIAAKEQPKKLVSAV